MAKVEQASDPCEAGYVRDADGNLIPDYDQTIKVFDDGDIVTGQVVKIDRDEVLVDIGYKSEGVIPSQELSIRKNIDPSEVVCVGDELDALVLQKEDKDGRLILSKKRAEYEKSWIRIEKLSKEESVLAGKVIEVVKGGLILDIGLRGFLPASLIDVRRVKDLHQFLGQELECKVIEMDRNRNNVVVSRRSVIDETRKAEREKVMESLKKGEVMAGKVSSIVEFGAFVDLGGVDGLIHISEMSWTHIDHPTEVLSMGEDINVKVLDIDQDRGRISLGLKQCLDDPWKKQTKGLKIGGEVEGTVAKIVSFGAFVTVAEGVEGLVHISELCEEHVEVPDEAVTVGETVCAKIIDLDPDRRRISLSIKQMQETGEGEKTTEEAEPVETETESKEEDAEKPAAKTKTAPKKVSETGAEDKKTAKAEKAAKKDEPKKTEKELVLESGDDADIEDALPKKPVLDEETSQAIGEALKIEADLREDQELEEELVTAPEINGEEPGSFEDVLEKIKETRGSKE